MQIDLDTQTVKAESMPDYVLCHHGEEYNTVRMFGITKEGHSVLAHLHSFLTYFYVEIIDQKISNSDISENDLEEFKDELNNLIPQPQGQRCTVAKVEVQMKKSIMGYQEKDKKFLKIYFSLPKYSNQLRQQFEKGNVFYKNTGHVFSTVSYESSIPLSLRYMIDNDITGMQWITVAPTQYKIRPKSHMISTCQIEVDIIDYRNAKRVPLSINSTIAPLRILSFDIEVSTDGSKFPTAKNDPVIQIANIVKIHGKKDPFARNVFTLKNCAQIIGTQVHSFQNEIKLLNAWRDFILEVDPDVITGYNTQNFDLPYIIERAQVLNICSFPKFSRLKDSFTVVKDMTIQLKAIGIRETKDINLEGRVMLDMMQVIIREYKLRSYTLNSVAYHFLKEQKEDVPYNTIYSLQNTDEFTRRRLAIYCIKDAYIPMRLLEKLQCIYNMSEMARVTGVPINYLFSRGQQIKVASQIYRKCSKQGFVIPNRRYEGGQSDKYEGAIVIEPIKGYYTEPIATLDFASLYPSIMIAHNLCYTTLVPKEVAKQLQKMGKFKADELCQTPSMDCFIPASKQKGILPMILEELISARKQAKIQLKQVSDPFERAVLEGRQLALKVSANSVYGFTGAQNGQLPCLPISCSVTAYGRQMIELTKKEVENKFITANGYQHNAQVIYGDTDSVMVKFGVQDRNQAMQLGSEAANFVSQKFKSPIKLEFEKLYHPYLLMNKKKYAGMTWTTQSTEGKIDCKGIETVRRDNCELVQLVVQGALDRLLQNIDRNGAIEYCKGIINDLLQNRIDLSLLVITKGLTKKVGGGQDIGGDLAYNDAPDSKTDSSMSKKKGKEEVYNSNQVHVKLAEKMKQRDRGSAPTVGDRVSYVMIKGLKGQKSYELAEDPIFVLNNDLPIDVNYYIENQIKQPLIRIFEPIFGSTQKAEKTLFDGDHTRSIYQPKLTTSSVGGLGRFTVVKETCMSCKKVLQKSDNGDCICVQCQPKKKQIYIERKLELNLAEKTYADLWVQCQRCQLSLHQEILCTSRDCPIFYRRIKAKKNLEDLSDLMQKFNEW